MPCLILNEGGSDILALLASRNPTNAFGEPKPAGEPGTSPHLVRQIGLAGGVAVVVGNTIGSGIFKSPAGIAERLPGPVPMLSVWVVGAIVVLCGALTLGEVGSAYPYSGGIYVYVREGFGRFAAFMLGWSSLILTVPAAIGAIAVVFAEYALRLAGRHAGQSGFEIQLAGMAILAIVLVAIANVLGVKLAATLQSVTAIAKTAGLLTMIVLAFVIGLPKTGGHFSPGSPPGSFSPSMFGLALVSALWVYDGWNNLTSIGGELSNPERNLPRAVILGSLSVAAIYLLANIAYLSVFSATAISKSSIVAADTMSSLVGSWGVTFIVATVMISTFGTLSASTLTNPRVFYAMGEDRLFFASLGRVHPRFKTPHVAVIACGLLGIVYVVIATALSGSKAFNSLTDAFVIAAVPFYALAVGAVFTLRRREKHRAQCAVIEDSLMDPTAPGHPESHPHAYSPSVRTPLYPLVPLLFIVSTVFLLANSLLDAGSRIPTIITLAIVLVGAPVYHGTIGRRPRG